MSLSYRVRDSASSALSKRGTAGIKDGDTELEGGQVRDGGCKTTVVGVRMHLLGSLTIQLRWAGRL